MSFVVHLLVLLGIDVHSLLGHPLTKLKFTLVLVPLWDRGRSEVAHNLPLCLSKEQWLLCQGELEPRGQNIEVQVPPTMLQQISLKGNIWVKRIPKLEEPPFFLISYLLLLSQALSPEMFSPWTWCGWSWPHPPKNVLVTGTQDTELLRDLKQPRHKMENLG